MAARREAPPDYVAQLFAKYDADADGVLSREEYSASGSIPSGSNGI